MHPRLNDLRANLEGMLELPPSAVQYLCDLFDTIQALDDWYDGDESAEADKRQAIWNSMAGLQLNPFYQQNMCHLLPLVANAVLKWQGADKAERQGRNLHMAYAWRAGFYDIVLQCVLLVHGSVKAMELAPLCLALYGESFEDYAKEFRQCQIQSAQSVEQSAS